ncbi:MAG: HAMP domain-containing histidine kinase [Trueperaceae bacterium]|nr:MAG: HAMP domain-containing histidine kinase [Trueperaceae bacterium]
MNLRLKLALTASLLTLLGLALGLGLTYWLLLGLRLNELDTESQLLAKVILEAAVSRSEDQVRIPTVIGRYLTDESGVSSAQVFLWGRLLWEGGVVSAPRPLDPEGLLGEEGGRSVSDWRVYTLKGVDEGLTVQVGRPLLSTWAILRPYNRIAIPLSLLLALLAGVVAWPTVGYALRPLRNLTEAASHFEDASDVPEVPGQDEPAKLARSFAALLARLRAERQREQRFLAYAAHELRTPLSGLRAGLEAARSRKVSTGPDMLDRLYREALRLEALAQNLLALSRAEAGEVRAESIDLSNLATDAYDRFLPLAVNKDLKLYLECNAAPAWGDAQLIEQALNNLLSNALRCTSRGAVTILSGLKGGRPFLAVHDTGPGFPDPIPEGLGLRVVRAVASAHAGELELETDTETYATLWLPRREEKGIARD